MAARKLAPMGWSDWVRGAEIEPSLYAADMSRLGEEIVTLLPAGARIFHFDVGDGHFVPPITIGPIVLQWISPVVRSGGGRMDCHLMTEHPERHFGAIAEAGGDSVTFHVEAVADPAEIGRQARDHGLEVGLAFKPGTEPEQVAEVAEPFDLVLCMSIEPGYSGQAFMPESLARIERLRELLPDDKHVQVDGGVGLDNVPDLRRAGANLLVAGTSIFGAPDTAAAYRALVDLA
jgi:ribulose-phosphate 3-epimerase